MPEKKNVILVMGSLTDASYGNIVLDVWNNTGVDYAGPSIASCHWHAGGEFKRFIDWIIEREIKIVVFLGGMELAAPGIIQAVLRNAEQMGCVVFGIPTDKAARSALENLPRGTPMITCGLNEVSVSHSVYNGALAIAHLIAMNNPHVCSKLIDFYAEVKAGKQLIYELELVSGQIPIKEKKGT